MEWIFYLYLLNTFFMLFIAIWEVRRPAKALNWITIVLIFPIIGFWLYLSTSNPKRIHGKRLTSSHNESYKLPDTYSHSASVIADALRNFTVHGLRFGQVQVLNNGIAKYEQLIKSLQKAQKTIDLEYYIYRNDQIGNRITELLIEKAANGVRVRFIRDGLGSKKFPRHIILQMMDAGIECRTIFPLRFPWIMSNWNYRDHCKIVTIDGKESFTGGINNLFCLLSYVNEIPELVKSFNDIDEELITYDFIAKQFLKEVQAIQRQGLVKNYVVIKEPTSHLGGRVMMNDSMS